MIADSGDHGGHAAEVDGVHRERAQGGAEGRGSQAGDVDDRHGARLLEGVELGDGAGVVLISGPCVLSFVGDGDLAVSDGHGVRVVADGHRADHGTGFQIEEDRAADLRDGFGEIKGGDRGHGYPFHVNVHRDIHGYGRAVQDVGNADAGGAGIKRQSGDLGVNESGDRVGIEPSGDVDFGVGHEGGAVVAEETGTPDGVVGHGERVLVGREADDLAGADGERDHLMLAQAGDVGVEVGEEGEE